MTNMSAIIVYIPLAFLMAFVCVTAILRDKRRNSIRTFTILSGLIFLWQICEIGYFATSNPFVARFLFDFKLAFVGYSAYVLFWFTIRFYRLEEYFGSGVVAMLNIVPIITAVLAATSPFHTLIRQELTILIDGVLHQVINVRGAWFWVHTLYCYALLFAILVMVIYQLRKLPKAYRLSSILLLLGVLITMATNLLMISNIISAIPVDITLIGMSVATIFFYIAVDRSDQMDFLVLARNEIFNYLEEYIFILDNDRGIMDTNQSAKQWMEGLGIAGTNNFDSLIKHLERVGAEFKKSVEGEQGIDIYLSDPHRKSIYNLREKSIYDLEGRQLGLFVNCMDVTKNRNIINHLEEIAGIDTLTGLPNRNSFEMVKVDVDVPTSLPLSVIMGDVNGLKTVNDNYGHHQGDELLRVTAQIMEECRPSNGRLFRVGGDEYVMLLPNCSSREVRQIIIQIARRLETVQNRPFHPSIALGHATKERPEQDLQTLIRVADMNMYSSKKGSHEKLG